MTACPVSRTPMPDCGCRYEWKNYGYLHGVNMGDGWVRMDTAQGCSEHRLIRSRPDVSRLAATVPMDGDGSADTLLDAHE